MIEVLTGKQYYGAHSMGHVLLVDGAPWHFGDHQPIHPENGKPTTTRAQALHYAKKAAARRGEEPPENLINPPQRWGADTTQAMGLPYLRDLRPRG